MAIREVLDMEYYLCNAFFNKENSDTFEGIRALLIDKDKNPKWKHNSIADVKNEEVEKLFTLRYGPSLKTANYRPRPD